MTEPKLLTEAEARDLYTVAGTDAFVRKLRERGMIAPEPEPVDPLLIEAREICASVDGSEDFLNGLWDHGVTMKIALTALRRNLERPTLTREMVREAVRLANHRVYLGNYGYADALYAALVERLK